LLTEEWGKNIPQESMAGIKEKKPDMI
jgi:hypothetical protein